MNRKYSLALYALLCGLALFFANSCRKIDVERTKVEDVAVQRARFFQTTSTTHPTVQTIARSIQRQDAARNFVGRLVPKTGYPVWDKAMMPTRSAQQARGMEEDTPGTVIIPFVKEGGFTTAATLHVSIRPTDTLYRMVYATQYPEFGFSSDTAQASATDLFHLFALFDREIFGHEFFRVKDRRLLRQTTGIGEGGNVFARLRREQSMARSIYITNCEPTDWVFRYDDEPECAGGCGIECPHYSHTTMECITTVLNIPDGDDGSGGSNPGGGDDGGGGTCNQDCNWEDEEPCPEEGTPVTGFECDPGWLPEIPWDDDAVQPDLTYDTLAVYENVSTYVTSSGQLITFPAGAQVQMYLNIDPAMHANGAVYGFSINGQKYVSIQQEYFAADAIAVPPPMFTGFYKLVNGRVNFDSLVDPSLLVPNPVPVDGLVKVVRIRWEKQPDGRCNVVRQLVDYRPNPTPPGDINTTSNENYNIEYAPASSGSTAESKPSTECPQALPVNPPAPAEQKTLSDYYTQSAAKLDSFLNNRLNSSVKVYFYDSENGSPQYTAGQGGVQVLTQAEQASEGNKFRDSVFTGSDADIHVKAYIVNGQWKYEVKLNYTTLGTVHPKIANHVQQVVAEIREQADAEAREVRTVGRERSTERYPVPGGEEFSKEGMGLLETISAIWDVGRHIIKEGQMPEFIWDRGVRSGITLTAVEVKYLKSVFKMPSAVGGATDQLVDELTGVMQMVKAGYDFIRHPGRSISTIWNGISNLNGQKVRQFLAAASGYDNYLAGGDRAKYQGGRHSVQVAMVVIGAVKVLTKGQDVVKGAGEEITGVQGFVPEAPGSPSAGAVKNAVDNAHLIKRIGNNDKLIMRNVEGGENVMIVIEKNGTNRDVYTLRKDDYKRPDGSTPDDNLLEEFVTQDATDVYMPPHTTRPPDFPDQGVPGANVSYHPQGQKNIGWNKELNALPLKSNHTYVSKHATFKTDGNGRVNKVEIAQLQKDPNFDYDVFRNGHQQTKSIAVKGGTSGTDQGGHLLAAQFGGPGEQINLVPMKATINQNPGTWFTMENEWASVLNNGGTVTNIEININYGSNGRPLSFSVEATVNGLPKDYPHTN